MPTLEEIEELTTRYAAAHDQVRDLVREIEARIARIKRESSARLHDAVKTLSARYGELYIALDGAKSQFETKKTRTFSGVKVGYLKLPGRVEIRDEEKTIALIRETVPKAQAELLIRARESVDKKACADLTAADLKRLGIRITDDTDVIVIKPTDSEIDKLVAALLAATAAEQEAA